jgi:hypothetical protein
VAIAQRETHATEKAMREHLEFVRDGLLKVMTSPLLSRTDGEIPGPIIPANIKEDIRHGT